ncbi:OLC1v1015787C1 [Oldenlandia corymbosa var. corymbosa]|uniref:OLC1v1015787C1 n=1 Tax=Oldenlandia corymbosa var. corymbosa TaxID=529605 RepID=A0AAV1E4C4_OLDCO|nr:OLC1v1015787C1 [Oldenlandia corymbosa var. corymbosa]
MARVRPKGRNAHKSEENQQLKDIEDRQKGVYSTIETGEGARSVKHLESGEQDTTFKDRLGINPSRKLEWPEEKPKEATTTNTAWANFDASKMKKPVYYECRPIQCNYYKNFGHRGEDYKKKISSEEAKTIEKLNQHKQKPVLSEWRIVQRGKGINVDEKLETPPPSNKSVITLKETIEKSR